MNADAEKGGGGGVASFSKCIWVLNYSLFLVFSFDSSRFVANSTKSKEEGTITHHREPCCLGEEAI